MVTSIESSSQSNLFPSFLRSVSELIDAQTIEALHPANILVGYGAQAVAQTAFFHLIEKEIQAGKSSDHIMTKFGIQIPYPSANEFSASIKPIRESGLYLPQNFGEDEIEIFYSDLKNIFFPIGKDRVNLNEEKINELIELFKHPWQPGDFTDIHLISKAKKYSLEMWKQVKKDYERLVKEPEAQKSIIGWEQDLINYYDAAVQRL